LAKTGGVHPREPKGWGHCSRDLGKGIGGGTSITPAKGAGIAKSLRETKMISRDLLHGTGEGVDNLKKVRKRKRIELTRRLTLKGEKLGDPPGWKEGGRHHHGGDRLTFKPRGGLGGNHRRTENALVVEGELEI